MDTIIANSVTNKGLIGLENPNLTCYINSIIQCLSNTELLKDYFVSNHNFVNLLKYKYEKKEAKELVNLQLNSFNLCRLIKNIWSSDNEHLKLFVRKFKEDFFKSFSQFRSFEQNDSHEMLVFILDKMHEEMKLDLTDKFDENILITNQNQFNIFSNNFKLLKNKKLELCQLIEQNYQLYIEYLYLLNCKFNVKNHSVINYIYNNIILTQITCALCNYESFSFENQFILSVPIPQIERKIATKDFHSVILCSGTKEIIKPEEYVHCCDKCKEYFSDTFIQMYNLINGDTTICYYCNQELEINQVVYTNQITKLVADLPLCSVTHMPIENHTIMSYCSNCNNYRSHLFSNFCNKCQKKMNYKIIKTHRINEPLIWNNPTNDIEIDNCLSNYFKTEILDEHNKYKCSKCEQATQAKKKIILYNPAEILIVHLKRFHYEMIGMQIRSNKISTFVKYNNRINIKDYSYSNKNYEYELFAINNHIGSLQGGHYYSYCKSIDGEWYKYDDATVTKITDATVFNNNSSYILFYKKI